jgi:serine/threonine-protein kinase
VGDDQVGTRRERRARAKVAKAQHRADRVAHQASGGRRRRWPSVLLVFLVIAGVAAGGYAYWYTSVRIPTYPMVALTGKNVAEVEAILAPNQWVLNRTNRFDDAAPVGRVLEQQPAPGTDLARGGTVSIVVSNGPPPVNVPTDLVGKPLADARSQLAALGLGADPVTRRFDEDVPADAVISLADGTAAVVLKGSDVGLVVSNGTQPRTIPDGLVGKPGDQAAVALKKLDLDITTTEAFSDTVAKGNVISMKPGAGEQVPKGSTVALVVSKGPETVPVPDVVGQSVVDAAKAIEAAGLTVSGTSGSPTKKVTASNPPAGTVVKKGSSVELSTDKDTTDTTDTTKAPGKP